MTDDSEDIFRRAAENYPLKTDSPDWDAVRKKMEAGGAVAEEIHVAKKKNKRWLLLLLLLLPFAVIEHTYSPVSNLFSSGKKHSKPGKALPVAANAAEETYKDKTTTENNTTGNKEHTTDAVSITQAAVPTKDLKAVNTNTITLDPAVAKQKNSTTNNTTTITSANQTDSLTPRPAQENAGTTKTKHPITTKKNNSHFENNDTVEKTKLAHNGRRITSKQKSRLGIKNAEATGNDDENKMASTTEVAPKEKTTNIVAEPEATKITVDTSKSIAKVEPAIKKPTADSAKATETAIAKKTDKTADKNTDEKKKQQHQKHFYVGLMAGPDLSLIKMQSLKKMGISFGLIAGYQINKRLSIETGFFKDEKKYSSDGKYFSTKKIQTYPNSKITYVSGTCYMYEIPLNIRYSFRQKTSSTMFVTAGICSYLMSKEDYDYDVKYYNTIYPYSKEYKSHDDQLAAVINISAGYTHKLGKIGDLRIEPYLKLPVNKVGTGDLPIQSFGIMVGITRKLF